MPTLYRIAKWSETYETHDTRKLMRLNWIPVPNKHDGLGFRMIAAEKDSAALFGVWNLLIQVASKTDRGHRGTLERGGNPLTASSLATMTGFPEKTIERGLLFFSHPSIGWLLAEQWQTDLPLSPDASGESPGRREGKGREGKEGNGREAPPATPVSLPFSSPDFAAAWAEYRQHRTEIKKPLTPTATTRALANLAEWGEARAIAAIRYSIANGYRGIFEEHKRHGRNQPETISQKYCQF